MAKLIITRTNQWTNRFRKIWIYMDNKLLCKISNNETLTLDIKAGQHEFFAQTDWISSPRITLPFETDTTKQLEMGSPVTWTVSNTLYIIAFLGLIVWKRFLPGNFINENFGWMLLAAMVLFIAVKRLIEKRRSMFYYMTYGMKKYIYLKEV